jgi:hypothetical protein
MTHDEFRQQYEAYPWDPYQPLAVILASGERVYIDMPEQVRLTPDELVITRRANPRKPERYRYAEIARLVPLLELPPDPGGMSYAEFDQLIRELLMAELFQPFVIELRNGERILIDHRGEIGRGGRHIILFDRIPRPSNHINYEQVARLIPISPLLFA